MGSKVLTGDRDLLLALLWLIRALAAHYGVLKACCGNRVSAVE
jgi:hypothetical protein